MEKEQNQKTENNTQIKNKDDEVIDEASNEKPDNNLDAKKEETISDKEFPDTKNRIFYGEEVKQIDEAQKKTVKGSNYITKVSNKQIRQQTNPEDSDQT